MPMIDLLFLYNMSQIQNGKNKSWCCGVVLLHSDQYMYSIHIYSSAHA